jgi:hypothetical protein
MESGRGTSKGRSETTEEEEETPKSDESQRVWEMSTN